MINTLDGLTILRFAKAFRGGGGIEHHLNDLDRILLTRNKAKIIRMYLETGSKSEKETIQEIGQGSLVEIPMPVSVIKANADKRGIKQSIGPFLKAVFRELIIYNPFLYRTFSRYILKRYYHPPMGLFPIKDAGEKVKRIHQGHIVDLLVMHYLGTVDSAEIIEEAKKLGIPYIYINHFSNDYFTNISIREQLIGAAGIAGVTDVGIPSWVKDHFYFVSNGVDMEMFNPVCKGTQSPGIETDIPIIIYPARIRQNKGQRDLIKAYSKLKSEGMRARIVFAGRTDCAEYEEELKELARKNEITDDVLFLGQLNREELRDWYGISSVMAFPTYHQEGLPRILMEAQAMKVPPVAYIIGGTPGALQNGKTGFLVRKGDIKTFTQRLGELLTNEEKRKKMGEEGRRFVQREFGLDALAERHEKFYLSVLKK